MPTKRQLDDLAVEYRHAKQFLAKAQLIIARNHEIASKITGLYSATSARGLFDAMEELRNHLNAAREVIANATPEDPA